jgi:hypothetical protein
MQHSFHKESGWLVTDADLYGGGGPWHPQTPKIFSKKKKNLKIITLNFVYFFSFTPQFFFSFNLNPHIYKAGPPPVGNLLLQVQLLLCEGDQNQEQLENT